MFPHFTLNVFMYAMLCMWAVNVANQAFSNTLFVWNTRNNSSHNDEMNKHCTKAYFSWHTWTSISISFVSRITTTLVAADRVVTSGISVTWIRFILTLVDIYIVTKSSLYMLLAACKNIRKKTINRSIETLIQVDKPQRQRMKWVRS